MFLTTRARFFFLGNTKPPFVEIRMLNSSSRLSSSAILNESIKSLTVRLIDGSGNEVVSLESALSRSRSEGLDLVCVAPEARPPVCKIFDYNLDMYRRRQTQKDAKKQQKKATFGQTKEIKMKGLIEDHDLQIKCERIVEALSKLHPVRVLVSSDNKIMKKRPDCLIAIPDRLLCILAEKSCEFTLQSQAIQKSTVELILIPSRTS
jgi:translation initiation factor IF-3